MQQKKITTTTNVVKKKFYNKCSKPKKKSLILYKNQCDGLIIFFDQFLRHIHALILSVPKLDLLFVIKSLPLEKICSTGTLVPIYIKKRIIIILKKLKRLKFYIYLVQIDNLMPQQKAVDKLLHVPIMFII